MSLVTSHVISRRYVRYAGQSTQGKGPASGVGATDESLAEAAAAYAPQRAIASTHYDHRYQQREMYVPNNKVGPTCHLIFTVSFFIRLDGGER